MTYSVAIRTLGTSGDMFRRELESLHKQTIKPDKIIVYIAKGYKRPEFQIGIEEYVWVKKGLVSQRALQYREIDSKYILLLDDDVELAPNSVELLYKALKENNADVVGADTFRTHELSLKDKFVAAVSNWVFPHCDKNWAFKLNSHGSSSYLYKPVKDCYPSQSCSGPASLWRKSTRLALHAEDEIIFDAIKHMTEDQAMFGKVYLSGYRLFVHYNCGIVHLDARINSQKYDNDPDRYYYRSRRLFILWWRTCYEPNAHKSKCVFLYVLKQIWLLFVHIGIALVTFKLRTPYIFIKGIVDGIRFVGTPNYKKVPGFLEYKKK